MTELECQSNQTPVIKSQKTELNQTIEELENTLRDKEEVCARVFSGRLLPLLPLNIQKDPCGIFSPFSYFIVSPRKWKS